MYNNHVISRSQAVLSPTYRQRENILKVEGEGMISATPDKSIITLGVVTESKEVSTAQSENAIAMSQIIESLTQMGIPNEDIKTEDYRIDIQYDYENGKQIMRGYKVTHLLQVTINQISQTGKIIDTAVQNGANIVSNIHFTIANPDDFYNQALSLAIKNAQQKAITIANTLGLTLNPIPIKVTESSISTPPVPFHAVMLAKSESTLIQPGQTQIRANILAEFIYFS